MTCVDKIYSVPIKYLCLENRDNILMWLYLIGLGNLSMAYQVVNQLDYPKASASIVDKILSIKNSIKSNGQRQPVDVVWVGDKIIPLDGSKRIVALLLLNCDTVIIRVKHRVANLSINGQFFNALHPNIRKDFLTWRDKLYESKRVTNTGTPLATVYRELHLLSAIQKGRSTRAKAGRKAMGKVQRRKVHQPR